ncbi:MAG: hypothetical protein QNJ46_08180 [Leptolyngbyaceae cyanobacterium MO_188.B28]|nr:hypothetical protein [Leptolyngbyaceae cyanobacterium MO_188.B28]
MPATPQERYPLSFHLCNSLDQSTLHDSAPLEIWANPQAVCSPLSKKKTSSSEIIPPQQPSKLKSALAFKAFGLALNWLCQRTISS